MLRVGAAERASKKTPLQEQRFIARARRSQMRGRASCLEGAEAVGRAPTSAVGIGAEETL